MTQELTQTEVDSFRETLCSAASRLFIEKGEGGVTLRALAQEVGVSRSTPYRYFANKDEILAAVQAAAFREFADVAEQAFSREEDPRKRLDVVCDAYVRFALEHPDTYRIMFEFFQRGDYPELQREGARARQVLFKTAEAATHAGLIQGDANMAAHALWATLHGVVSLHLVGQLHWGPDVEVLARRTMDAVLSGLANESEG